MVTRQRSPSYPSTPLPEAIELVKKIHLIERANPIDRAVAAKAMGYSGMSGRSATILSNLIQFGLLEKAGKNEVRVTRRAVEIIYPDTDDSKVEALLAAAREPELFRAISERFTDGRPSETALQAYLIRQGFTHTAVAPASRAFLDTLLFLENEAGSGSQYYVIPTVVESQQNQSVERIEAVSPNLQTLRRSDGPALPATLAPASVEGYDVRIWNKTIWLAGTVRTQKEADELIATLTALKAMLPAPVEVSFPSSPEDEPEL